MKILANWFENLVFFFFFLVKFYGFFSFIRRSSLISGHSHFPSALCQWHLISRVRLCMVSGSPLLITQRGKISYSAHNKDQLFFTVHFNCSFNVKMIKTFSLIPENFVSQDKTVKASLLGIRICISSYSSSVSKGKNMQSFECQSSHTQNKDKLFISWHYYLNCIRFLSSP